MVTKSKTNLGDLPAPGDEVDVDWGLDTVRGHVLDVYLGTRPRAVVEIDPGQVGDSSATVTMPVEAIRPSPTAQSPWARHFRYEQDLVRTLRRIGKEAVVRVDVPTKGVGLGVDLILEADDGRIMVIEAKSSREPFDERRARAALDQLRRSARALNAHGLLVSDQSLPMALGHPHEEDVSVVHWRGEGDDQDLTRELSAFLNRR